MASFTDPRLAVCAELAAMEKARGAAARPPKAGCPSGPIFQFEVVGEDVLVELCAGHTVYHLVEVLCDNWLDDARAGDGAVYAHLWDLTLGDGSTYRGPHLDEGFAPPRTESEHSSTALKDLPAASLTPGAKVKMLYDYDSTTRCTLRLVSVVDPGVGAAADAARAACPRRVPAGDAPPPPHRPPRGTPTMDATFPKLAALAMQPATSTVFLFGAGGTPGPAGVAAALEANPGAMGDLLCANQLPGAEGTYGNAEELLLSCDAAAAQPAPHGIRADAFVRLVFPVRVPEHAEAEIQSMKEKNEALEAKLAAWKQRHPSRPAMMAPGYHTHFTAEEQYEMMGPKQALTRLDAASLQAGQARLQQAGFDFARAFPAAARACDPAQPAARRGWLFLQNRVLTLGRGPARKRGRPAAGSRYARVRCEVKTLQELFCVAEAVWAQEEGDGNKSPPAKKQKGASSKKQAPSVWKVMEDGDDSEEEQDQDNHNDAY